MNVHCDGCGCTTDNVKIVTTRYGDRLLCEDCKGDNYVNEQNS